MLPPDATKVRGTVEAVEGPREIWSRVTTLTSEGHANSAKDSPARERLRRSRGSRVKLRELLSGNREEDEGDQGQNRGLTHEADCEQP